MPSRDELDRQVLQRHALPDEQRSSPPEWALEQAEPAKGPEFQSRVVPETLESALQSCQFVPEVCGARAVLLAAAHGRLPMWKLSIEDDQGHRTVVSLLRDEYSIGRSQENTVRLTERNISRRHAVIRRTDAGWSLEDQSSYNGCFVNGSRVSSPRVLEHGDLVQLGDYRLETLDESKAPAAPSPTGAQPGHAPGEGLTGQPDRLVMVAGPTPGAEFPIDEERVVLGRGEDCDVAINHASVSRLHAEIHQLGDGRFEIIDRDSANGVRVNGIELKRALLDARDVVELGDIVFKFIPAGEVYRPTSAELKRLGPTSQEPASAAPVVAAPAARPAVPRALKIGGGLAVAALLLAAALFALGDRHSSESQTAASAAIDDAVRILTMARAALDRGEVEKAHVLATNGVPESSNARQAQDFLDIEARWADMLFGQAEHENDRERKRSALDRIAKTTTVDSARRKRAADLLASLDGEGVDLRQLPKQAKVDPAAAPEPTALEPSDRNPPPIAAPAANRAQRTLVQPGGPTKARPTAEASPPAPEPTSAEPPPAATPKSPVAPRSPSTTTVQDQATSGDRARQIAAKDALKAKVAAGHATDQDRRLLRALCRQFSDTTCSN